MHHKSGLRCGYCKAPQHHKEKRPSEDFSLPNLQSTFLQRRAWDEDLFAWGYQHFKLHHSMVQHCEVQINWGLFSQNRPFTTIYKVFLLPSWLQCVFTLLLSLTWHQIGFWCVNQTQREDKIILKELYRLAFVVHKILQVFPFYLFCTTQALR